MAQFTYRAKKGLHETLEGFIEADSQDAALSRLVEQGLFPVHIEVRPVPDAGRLAPRTPRKRPSRGFTKRIGSKDLLLFTQNLTTLIRAHVDLLAAIRILYEQAEAARFKATLLDIYNATKEGSTFSESLSRFPEVFSPLFINLVKSGEASGHLDIALQHLSETLGRDEALKTRIRSALAYPVLLVVVGLGSIAVLMIFVVPKLEPLFVDLGGALPLMTRLILNLSHVTRQVWLWVALVGGGAVGVFVWQRGTGPLGRWIARLVRQLPVFRRLIRNQELLHFAHSLNLLLRSGVPVLRALQIVTPSMGDERLRAQMEGVCERVALGETLSQSLHAHTELPVFLTRMIAVGEESGKLDEVLDEVVRSSLQQIEADLVVIGSLIEPVLILGLGTVLGTIVLSILLPVFQITQAVR